MGKTNRIITEKRIQQFMNALREQERSPATIQKYILTPLLYMVFYIMQQKTI